MKFVVFRSNEICISIHLENRFRETKARTGLEEEWD
jgi:hypothetical protein